MKPVSQLKKQVKVDPETRSYDIRTKTQQKIPTIPNMAILWTTLGNGMNGKFIMFLLNIHISWYLYEIDDLDLWKKNCRNNYEIPEGAKKFDREFVMRNVRFLLFFQYEERIWIQKILKTSEEPAARSAVVSIKQNDPWWEVHLKVRLRSLKNLKRKYEVYPFPPTWLRRSNFIYWPPAKEKLFQLFQIEVVTFEKTYEN